jgi:Family of unknown function (DUF5681)
MLARQQARRFAMSDGGPNAPYKVGYRKPPKSGQFKKGLSGNPGGRPKKLKSWSELVAEELQRTIAQTSLLGRPNSACAASQSYCLATSNKWSLVASSSMLAANSRDFSAMPLKYFGKGRFTTFS